MYRVQALKTRVATVADSRDGSEGTHWRRHKSGHTTV